MNASGSSEFEKYITEVKEKWGETTAYKEYEKKTKEYSGKKREESAEGLDGITEEFALCMKNSHSPDSVEAQELVKTLQEYITENFYPCTNDILSGLGQMYTADERFRNSIDKHAGGTAAFIREAIEVYCGR